MTSINFFRTGRYVPLGVRLRPNQNSVGADRVEGVGLVVWDRRNRPVGSCDRMRRAWLPVASGSRLRTLTRHQPIPMLIELRHSTAIYLNQAAGEVEDPLRQVVVCSVKTDLYG